jgi:hypothetical protein
MHISEASQLTECREATKPSRETRSRRGPAKEVCVVACTPVNLSSGLSQQPSARTKGFALTSQEVCSCVVGHCLSDCSTINEGDGVQGIALPVDVDVAGLGESGDSTSTGREAKGLSATGVYPGVKVVSLV